MIRHPNKTCWLMGCCLAGVIGFWVGCGGTQPVKTAEETVDAEFYQTSRSARLAFEKGRISQAIALYRKALERAYILDDLNAIVDTRYNLAVCQLAREAYAEALIEIEKSQAELQLAGRSPPPDLLLIEAMARYKNGDLAKAWQITERLKSEPSPTSQNMADTRYLRGLIAADRGKAAQMKAEIAALGQPTTPRFQADRFELIGRLAMLEGRYGDAVAALDEAARLRAESQDYRSMASILATAAQACEKAQRYADAAYRYLRAARGALSKGDKLRAADWIQEAVRLARRAESDAILEEALYYQSILSVDKSPR